MIHMSRGAFINASDPEEVSYWCEVLKIDRAELLFTIAAVGNSPTAVIAAVQRRDDGAPHIVSGGSPARDNLRVDSEINS
ncbi:MAG TPA: DUF3606 domain-containing protein [Xanthobacteraceae bacterium]|nr:DUF3606 domain-containing protein [Xanthobacteraceae bacterium]